MLRSYTIHFSFKLQLSCKNGNDTKVYEFIGFQKLNWQHAIPSMASIYTIKKQNRLRNCGDIFYKVESRLFVTYMNIEDINTRNNKSANYEIYRLLYGSWFWFGILLYIKKLHLCCRSWEAISVLHSKHLW